MDLALELYDRCSEITCYARVALWHWALLLNWSDSCSCSPGAILMISLTHLNLICLLNCVENHLCLYWAQHCSLEFLLMLPRFYAVKVLMLLRSHTTDLKSQISCEFQDWRQNSCFVLVSRKQRESSQTGMEMEWMSMEKKLLWLAGWDCSFHS